MAVYRSLVGHEPHKLYTTSSFEGGSFRPPRTPGRCMTACCPASPCPAIGLNAEMSFRPMHCNRNLFPHHCMPLFPTPSCLPLAPRTAYANLSTPTTLLHCTGNVKSTCDRKAGKTHMAQLAIPSSQMSDSTRAHLRKQKQWVILCLETAKSAAQRAEACLAAGDCAGAAKARLERDHFIERSIQLSTNRQQLQHTGIPTSATPPCCSPLAGLWTVKCLTAPTNKAEKAKEATAFAKAVNDRFPGMKMHVVGSVKVAADDTLVFNVELPQGDEHYNILYLLSDQPRQEIDGLSFKCNKVHGPTTLPTLCLARAPYSTRPATSIGATTRSLTRAIRADLGLPPLSIGLASQNRTHHMWTTTPPRNLMRLEQMCPQDTTFWSGLPRLTQLAHQVKDNDREAHTSDFYVTFDRQSDTAQQHMGGEHPAKQLAWYLKRATQVAASELNGENVRHTAISLRARYGTLQCPACRPRSWPTTSNRPRYINTQNCPSDLRAQADRLLYAGMQATPETLAVLADFGDTTEGRLLEHHKVTASSVTALGIPLRNRVEVKHGHPHASDFFKAGGTTKISTPDGDAVLTYCERDNSHVGDLSNGMAAYITNNDKQLMDKPFMGQCVKNMLEAATRIWPKYGFEEDADNIKLLDTNNKVPNPLLFLLTTHSDVEHAMSDKRHFSEHARATHMCAAVLDQQVISYANIAKLPVEELALLLRGPNGQLLYSFSADDLRELVKAGSFHVIIPTATVGSLVQLLLTKELYDPKVLIRLLSGTTSSVIGVGLTQFAVWGRPNNKAPRIVEVRATRSTAADYTAHVSVWAQQSCPLFCAIYVASTHVDQTTPWLSADTMGAQGLEAALHVSLHLVSGSVHLPARDKDKTLVTDNETIDKLLAAVTAEMQRVVPPTDVPSDTEEEDEKALLFGQFMQARRRSPPGKNKSRARYADVASLGGAMLIEPLRRSGTSLHPIAFILSVINMQQRPTAPAQCHSNERSIGS